MNKDWRGNKKTVFVTLGASNHTSSDRAEYDYYATEPIAADMILSVEKFNGDIWENACGEGHLAKRIEELGYNVISTDLIDRGFGKCGVNFFSCKEALAPNIITNPPYKYAKEWVEKSLELLPQGGKLAMFLPIQFLESETRESLLKDYPPKTVYVCTNRVRCGKNGDFFDRDDNGNIKLNKDGTPKLVSSAKCYAWFVWVKGEYDVTLLKQINRKDFERS